MTIEIDEEDLGLYCWVLTDQLDRWIPPDKTAEECMEAVEDDYEDNPEMDWDEGFAWEEGYHVGAMAMTEEDIRGLRNKLGIDVLNRAEEYRREECDNIPPFEFPENWLKGYGSSYVFGEEEVQEYLDNGGNTGPDWTAEE